MSLVGIPNEAIIGSSSNAVTVSSVSSVVNANDSVTLTFTMSDGSTKTTTINIPGDILGSLNNDILPATTDTYDIGSFARRFDRGHVKEMRCDELNVNDILTYNLDSVSNITLNTDLIPSGIGITIGKSNNQIWEVHAYKMMSFDLDTSVIGTLDRHTGVFTIRCDNVNKIIVNATFTRIEDYLDVDAIKVDDIDTTGDNDLVFKRNDFNKITLTANNIEFTDPIKVDEIDTNGDNDLTFKRNNVRQFRLADDSVRFDTSIRCNEYNTTTETDVEFKRFGDIKIILTSDDVEFDEDIRVYNGHVLRCNEYDSNSNNDVYFSRNGVEYMRFILNEVLFSQQLRLPLGTATEPAVGWLEPGDGRRSGFYFGSAVIHFVVRDESQFLIGTNGMILQNYIEVGGNCYPTLNNTYDLGTSTFKWDDVYATNNVIQTSDQNQKQNIANSDLGLDFINALTPRKYKFIDGQSGRYHYGLIAQEVKTAMDTFNILTADFAGYINTPPKDIKDISGNVTGQSDETFGLRYNEFLAPMMKAIQELSTKIDGIHTRLEALEN